jgi:hypothetical protein
MENLENLPPVRWSMTHPRLAAWIVLSAGMVILLVIEARDVGLTVGNWIALIVMTILVAGACVWIVSWEDVDESEPVDVKTAAAPVDTSETPVVNADNAVDVEVVDADIMDADDGLIVEEADGDIVEVEPVDPDSE